MSDGDRVTRTASLSTPRFELAAGSVRVVDGADRGKSWSITREPTVIGSADGCDVTLRDARVSRRHCRITLAPYGFVIEDLGSRNGTYFEGSRVGHIAVPPGAIVRVGNTHLAVSSPRDAGGIDPSPHEKFGELVGRSLAMRRLFALLERAAASDVTVLIEGETGTGKDVAARAIHEASARRDQPFEVIDCSAIVPTLLASELSGHVRGAFTGAARDRAGAFERAAGGTVLLDEIGELPLDLQPALLRALETRTVTRLGDSAPIATDVRIIAATHRDLASDVIAGRFREDLYYRLQVLPISLPPLRARREDLPLMCEAILARLGDDAAGAVDGPNLALLAQYAWPGNVRELRNVLERALALAGGRAPFRALALELPTGAATRASTASGGGFQERKRDAILQFEREFLVELLREHGDNIKRASRASGIERTQLKRLLRKHGLR